MLALNWSDPSIVWVALARLLLALGLGAAVGLEREIRGRPAGLRTSAFICFGAALFTMISTVLAHEHGGDPQRITAQIIPGIGFLGAGAILRERGSITGMTSAATIFVVASIGMAVGGGLGRIAMAGTVLVLVVLGGLRWAEHRFHLKTLARGYYALGSSAADMMREIHQAAEVAHASLNYVRCQKMGEDYSVEFGARLHPSDAADFLRHLRQQVSLREIVPTAGADNERD